MKNIFVIVCSVFLLFGDMNADAGLRCRQQRSCCQPASCQQPTCCQKPARQPRRRCCASSCSQPAASCCQPASSCSQPASSCCGGAVVSAVEAAPVASAAVYEAPVVSSAVVESAPAVASDAMYYEGGNNFVQSAPASDCGCGDQVGVVESGDMSYSVAPEAAQVSEGVIIDGGVSEGVMTEGVSEGVTTEGVIESPASEVPAAPVGDSSSYLGAPALQPGEWVVEGSEKVVEAGATTEATEGVTATPASSSEVVYESATATTTEAAATDAVPSAPSEEAAEEKAE